MTRIHIREAQACPVPSQPPKGQAPPDQQLSLFHLSGLCSGTDRPWNPLLSFRAPVEGSKASQLSHAKTDPAWAHLEALARNPGVSLPGQPSQCPTHPCVTCPVSSLLLPPPQASCGVSGASDELGVPYTPPPALSPDPVHSEAAVRDSEDAIRSSHPPT